MNSSWSHILDELAVFADLGTPPPKVEQKQSMLVVRLYRSGEEVTLGFHREGAGKVVERADGRTEIHPSYVALLASERFGNLRLWAHTQELLLRKSLADLHPPEGIRITGVLASDSRTLDVDGFDKFLECDTAGREAATRVALIDGPAGIGKTKFIEMIAWSRAKAYATSRRPLVLHVQSRGRVLSYLQDLMAFSLQRLRLSVTFDQLPVLARHGLVTLAIDGFDELGDPNGYDLAWSQVNDMVVQLRGQGTLVLAGRETFIGLDRLRNALNALTSQDAVYGLKLQSPSTDEAERWLRRKKWQKDDVASIRYLLDAGSYALRPFFLAQLADRSVAGTLRESQGTNLLPILVDVMLRRESGKFGDAVDAALSAEERLEYTHRLLREVARFMADDETDIIDETSLTWLVEPALPTAVNSDVLALLTNRAGVIAFLAKDVLPSYLRFSHSQLLNYFLSVALIEALVAGEVVPKFVRRNVFSADFVAVFADVVRHLAHQDASRCLSFFDRAYELLRSYQSIDRGARNLGAWLVAALPTVADITEHGSAPRLVALEVDETIMKGTVPPATLRDVTINQLDIRAADLRSLTLENCAVNTAIVDDSTRLPPSFPSPGRLRIPSAKTGQDEDVWDNASIRKWLDVHGSADSTADDSAPSSQHAQMLRVVERACRSSSFWIPEDTDTKIDRFVKDPTWPTVLELLKSHGFIREERLGVSGRKSRFVHIRQAERILANDPADEDVARLHEAIARAAQ